MMWNVICLVVLVVVIGQVNAQLSQGVLTANVFRSTCCQCGGTCVHQYCRYPWKDVNPKYVNTGIFWGKCECPAKGLVCCQKVNIDPTRCVKVCGGKCVPSDVKCSRPYTDHDCPCPKGLKCCKGPLCFECGGRCVERGKCVWPYYELKDGKCPCPFGLQCCKLATCGERCFKNAAKCVPKGIDCKKPITSMRCTCPPSQQCCKFDCRIRCGGTCVYGPCPWYMRHFSPEPCNCPSGHSCCRGNCPSPSGCISLKECKISGGWPIPSTNCQGDLVCCQRRTCGSSKYCPYGMCVSTKISCSSSSLPASKCACPPGQKCCRYSCGLPACRGVCRSGGCFGEARGVETFVQANQTRVPLCTCPIGQKCCRVPCPYKPCVPKAICDQVNGNALQQVYDCPIDHVCCQGTCHCPKKYLPCVSHEQCLRSRGIVLPSTSCFQGKVCCKRDRIMILDTVDKFRNISLSLNNAQVLPKP